MARVYLAPAETPIPDVAIFLAGSIDMGAAVDWQTEVTNALIDLNVDIYNPRRTDWDSTWQQSITNAKFLEQVEWELEHLEKADIICFYFDPSGPAPITLLELGLHAKTGKCLVCCPDGYWRKGNVEVVCSYYDIPMFDDLQSLIDGIKKDIL